MPTPTYLPTYASPSTSYQPRLTSRLVDSFILKEDSFYLLLENGFKIILYPHIEYGAKYAAGSPTYTPTYS